MTDRSEAKLECTLSLNDQAAQHLTDSVETFIATLALWNESKQSLRGGRAGCTGSGELQMWPLCM